jgi:hypothetical protein
VRFMQVRPGTRISHSRHKSVRDAVCSKPNVVKKRVLEMTRHPMT